jgi:hypothetical protein
MEKNKRYSKEEMYHAIELWQESGLSQKVFCSREKLSLPAFGYWLRKYRDQKEASTQENLSGSFIPVEVPGVKTAGHSFSGLANIEVSFPNGVRLSCPVSVDIAQLKTLINF